MKLEIGYYLEEECASICWEDSSCYAFSRAGGGGDTKCLHYYMDASNCEWRENSGGTTHARVKCNYTEEPGAAD